jgi:hypothetical protein
MNLAPIQVEHAHHDGMRRPLQVSDKRDRASDVSPAIKSRVTLA